MRRKVVESADAKVTRILSELKDGDDQATVERLLPAIYGELRQLAATRLAREKPGHVFAPVRPKGHRRE